MQQVTDFSPRLVRDEEGLWVSGHARDVSYPADQHDACREIEEASFWFKHRNHCLLEVLKRFPPPGLLFDVGGGNGFTAAALMDAGLPAAVVEPGRKGALNARRRGVTDVICSTLEDADFTAGSLPAVGLFDVLEHIERDAAFMNTVHHLVMPGGRLYITVPVHPRLWSVEDEAAGHVRRYTRKGVYACIIQAGFAVEFESYMFNFLPLPILLFRVWSSRLGLRRSRSHDRNAREHGFHSALMNAGISRVLLWERRRLQNGHRVPFGASYLVAARKY